MYNYFLINFKYTIYYNRSHISYYSKYLLDGILSNHIYLIKLNKYKLYLNTNYTNYQI